MCVSVCVGVCECACACMHACVHACACLRVCVCQCVCGGGGYKECMYVMHVCVCVWGGWWFCGNVSGKFCGVIRKVTVLLSVRHSQLRRV